MRTPNLSLWLTLLGTLALLAACGGGRRDARAPGGVEPADPSSRPPAVAADAPPVAADKFGVVECDEFVAAYRECMKIQATENWRPYLKSNLEQMLARFRQLAANDQTRPALAETCLMTRQIMKPALMDHGCFL
jgi:hypothetical protein